MAGVTSSYSSTDQVYRRQFRCSGCHRLIYPNMLVLLDSRSPRQMEPEEGFEPSTLRFTRRMLGVDLDGIRRIWPAHVGCLVGPDGSRRITWMIKRMIKGLPTQDRMARQAPQGGVRGQLIPPNGALDQGGRSGGPRPRWVPTSTAWARIGSARSAGRPAGRRSPP